MSKSVSSKCISLVKEFEGCRLKAYQDEVGVLTIGYGTTNSDKSITGKKIVSGLEISQTTADAWLESSLNKKYLPAVLKYDNEYNWNQNEIDALVSFAYNIGSIGGLTANGSRTRAEIAEKMLEYNKAGGRVYNGLTRRRKAEQKLFLTKVSVSYKVGKKYTLLSEMKVRTAPGTSAAVKKHSQLTADGKKHDKDNDGYLDKGTVVSCKAVKVVNGDVWIQTPSGWIAAVYNGKTYVK